MTEPSEKEKLRALAIEKGLIVPEYDCDEAVLRRMLTAWPDGFKKTREREGAPPSMHSVAPKEPVD